MNAASRSLGPRAERAGQGARGPRLPLRHGRGRSGPHGWRRPPRRCSRSCRPIPWSTSSSPPASRPCTSGTWPRLCFPSRAASPGSGGEDERVAFLTHVVAALSHVRATAGRAALGVDLHLWVRELTRIDRAASSAARYLWSDDGALADPAQGDAGCPAARLPRHLLPPLRPLRLGNQPGRSRREPRRRRHCDPP